MDIIRTDKEIDELMNRCIESENAGASEYPGMTYEQGIKAAIEWLEGGYHPFE